MKSCPTCQASYSDEANFCGADGAALVRDAPAATQHSLNVAERLERLHELYAMGLLNEFEYAIERRKISAEG